MSQRLRRWRSRWTALCFASVSHIHFLGALSSVFSFVLAAQMAVEVDGPSHFLGVSQASDPAPYIAIRRRAVELSVPFDDYRLVPAPRSGAETPERAAS